MIDESIFGKVDDPDADKAEGDASENSIFGDSIITKSSSDNYVIDLRGSAVGTESGITQSTESGLNNKLDEMSGLFSGEETPPVSDVAPVSLFGDRKEHSTAGTELKIEFGEAPAEAISSNDQSLGLFGQKKEDPTLPDVVDPTEDEKADLFAFAADDLGQRKPVEFVPAEETDEQPKWIMLAAMAAGTLVLFAAGFQAFSWVSSNGSSDVSTVSSESGSNVSVAGTVLEAPATTTAPPPSTTTAVPITAPTTAPATVAPTSIAPAPKPVPKPVPRRPVTTRSPVTAAPISTTSTPAAPVTTVPPTSPPPTISIATVAPTTAPPTTAADAGGANAAGAED